MSYRGPEVLEWERRLREVFARVDAELEARHGGRFPRHAQRPPHGSPAAPQYDGLFNVGAVYSPGYGSRLGPGYVVEVRLATWSRVPTAVQQEIEDEAAELLRTELPKSFPERRLEVTRDGPAYKIHGDLRLTD